MQVPLLITQAQKHALRDLGYGDAQIRVMRPATAHAILGLHGAALPASPAVTPSTANGTEPAESTTALANPAVDPTVRQTILAYKDEHPEASVESIHRQLKIKKSTVAIVLQEFGR